MTNDVSERGKKKRLREGKSGKRDFIEDILGTEELSGTYEERDKMTKMLEKEKRWVAEYNRKKLQRETDKENEYLRQDRIKQFVKINQHIEFILRNTLQKDAFQFLNELRNKAPQVCWKIIRCILPPEEQLGMLSEMIMKKGPNLMITKEQILHVYRFVTGTKQKIEVVRDGERKQIA